MALLLLGGIVALVAYKNCQKPAEQPVAVVPPDAAPPPKPTNTIDDEIPPPPVIEDASVPETGTKRVVAFSNQCDAKQCTGSRNTELETALAFRAKQAHRCYDNALAQDPTLRGKVAIAVRIGANGQTCTAGVASNEFDTPNIAMCVAGFFRGQSFPAPGGGCLDVNIPINFVPRQ